MPDRLVTWWHTLHKWERRLYKVWFISYLVLSLGVVGLYFEVTRQADENRRVVAVETANRDLAICRNSNQARNTLRAFLLTLIERSDNSVDSIAYYIEHPEERKAVHEQNATAQKDIRTQLAAKDCRSLAEGEGRG